MKNSNDKALIKAFKSVRAYFLYGTLFSAALNLLMISPILYMLLVYDRVVSSGSMETLTMLSVLLLLLLSSSGGFDWARTKLLVAANVRTEKDLRAKVSKSAFKHALYTGSHNQASQAMSDLINLRQFVTGNGVIALMDAPWVPIYIGVMFAFHTAFGISAIIAAILMILLAVVTQKSTSERLASANSFSRAAQASFGNNLRNTEVIHGMGMSANIQGRDELLFDKASSEQAHASIAAGRLAALSKSFRQLSQSALLGLGAYLAVNGQISPGMMIAGSLLLGRALAPIDMLVGSWKGFIDAKGQYERLDEILRAYPEDIDRLKLPAPEGRLVIDNLVVVPPGSDIPSVRGATFALNAGGALGIIGPSAAGKTSLARAILGVWPASRGIVRLDSADINKWDRNDLGPYLGYLPQDIELFNGSIAENICRFSKIDSDKIIEAAKTAGIHNMILGLPEGYDTLINSTAGALSAGQRQRVGLARAIYGGPKMIILDEPNSNLDDQGEKYLLAALREMKGSGCTIIVITHRTSILSLVDHLIVMKNGIIDKSGPRDDVIKAISGKDSNVTKLPSKT